MTIQRVTADGRRRAFLVRCRRGTYVFPYAKLDLKPTKADPILTVVVDPEVARQGFTYRLSSGREGTVLLDQVLDYNKDPRFVRDMLVYQLSCTAQTRVAESGLGTRELARRLNTSPAQVYRLLDQTNTRKSVDQLLRLFAVLDCDVSVDVRPRGAPA